MQTTTISDIDANRLHDYLIANLPDFHRVDESRIALADCGRVFSLGADVTIEFADDIDPGAISEAIAAFQSNPPVNPSIAVLAAQQSARAKLVVLGLTSLEISQINALVDVPE